MCPHVYLNDENQKKRLEPEEMTCTKRNDENQMGESRELLEKTKQEHSNGKYPKHSKSFQLHRLVMPSVGHGIATLIQIT